MPKQNVQVAPDNDQHTTDFTKALSWLAQRFVLSDSRAVDGAYVRSRCCSGDGIRDSTNVHSSLSVFVTGGLGRRLDHLMSNINTLHSAAAQYGAAMNVFLVGAESLAYLLPAVRDLCRVCSAASYQPGVGGATCVEYHTVTKYANMHVRDICMNSFSALI